MKKSEEIQESVSGTTQAPDLRGSSSFTPTDGSVENFSVVEIIRLHNELSGIKKTVSELAKTVLEKAIKLGDLLTQNKAAVPHGGWLKWIKKNLPFGCRQAQKYITVYERRDVLSNANPSSHLSINAYLLLMRNTDRARDGISQRTPIDDFGGDATPVAQSAINDLGGIVSKSAAKASGRYNGNADLWDDKPALSHPTHNKIYNPNGGQMPDQVANGLHEQGLIHEPFASQMFGAIKSESQSARTAAREERAQARLAKFAEIEALPEVQVFSQFLNTQSKRDAVTILAVLALRRGIIDSAGTVVAP